MKSYNLKTLLVLTPFFLYPYYSLYSPLIENKSGLPGVALLILFFMPVFILNLKGFIGFAFKRIPYYYIGIAIAFIALFWSADLTRGVFYVISLILASLVGYTIIKLNIVMKVWQVFSITVIIFSLLLSFEILQKGFVYYDVGGSRFGYIQGLDIYLDPNWLAVWLSISFIYYFLFWMGDIIANNGGISRKKKWASLILSILSIYFLLATGSRSALLALLAVIFIYFVLKKNYYLLLIGLVASLIILVLSEFGRIKEDSLINRTLQTNFMENDRIGLAISSLRALMENASTFFFGYGTGSGDRATGIYYEGAVLFDDGIYRYNNHNMYLDWVLQTGALGMFFMLGMFILLLYTLLISIKIKNYPYILLLVFLSIEATAYNPVKNSIWSIACGLLIALFSVNSLDIKKGECSDLNKMKSRESNFRRK